MHPLILPLLFTFLLVPGLFMTLLPMMPALTYMFVVAGVFALIDEFVRITPANLAVLGGILALSILIDWSAGLLGARFGGASVRSLLYGIAGLFVGGILFFPFGGLVGLFAGVLVAELLADRSSHEALRAATGSFLGAVGGMLTNAFLALLFFGLFLYFLFV